jgi:AcrR family transcriptional regulator
LERYLNSVKIKVRRKRAKRKSYHHGDLRHQLLVAAEQIISERGVEGFTLREAARRAGVSPAAPAHHFKDAKGLLTQVALLGFQDFGEALKTADQAGDPDPTMRLHRQAAAYVRFALKHPARFQLMFRSDTLDKTNEEFVRIAHQSYQVLEDAIRAATHTPAERDLAQDTYGLLIASWSMVHGFSHLALGGELSDAGDADADLDAVVSALLPAMLKYLPTPAKTK